MWRQLVLSEYKSKYITAPAKVQPSGTKIFLFFLGKTCQRFAPLAAGACPPRAKASQGQSRAPKGPFPGLRLLSGLCRRIGGAPTCGTPFLPDRSGPGRPRRKTVQSSSAVLSGACSGAAPRPAPLKTPACYRLGRPPHGASAPLCTQPVLVKPGPRPRRRMVDVT